MLLCMPKRTPSDRTAEIAGWFAIWLRRRRAELGWTQEDLAHRSGMSRNQVQNIENSRNNQRDEKGRTGSGNPRLDTVFALARALRVEVGYLVDPEAQPDPGRARLRRWMRRPG